MLYHSLGVAYWFSYCECLATNSAGDTLKNNPVCLDKSLSMLTSALKFFHPDQFPEDCRKTASFLGDRFAENQNWGEAVSAYQKALQATESLYRSSLLRTSQEVELSESGDLSSRATFALAKVGDLRAAVLTLEKGRARALSEALQRDRINLAQIATLAPDYYQQYLTAANALRQFEADERSANSLLSTKVRPHLSQEQLIQRSTQIRQSFREAISNIKKLQGYEKFLDEQSFEDITAVVTSAKPLVYLLSSAQGSLSLIVHVANGSENIHQGSVDSYQIKAIWLNDLTESFLDTILVGDGNEQVGWFEAYNNRQVKRDVWLQAMDLITHQLWTLLMEPVVLYLESLGVTQAVLIPTGNLGLIPLHAAWTEDETKATGRCYGLDRIAFTYAPNALSVDAAKAVANCTVANSLLAVSEPRPTAASTLPNSEREVKTAITFFPYKNLSLCHEQASRNAVISALPNYDVFHFSCHGFVNGINPLESGLVMANDEVLSLRDFFNQQLQGARLAILSACETVLPGTKLPDEVLGLPTGLLQTGVAGIVASFWSVSDLSTMMLLVRFYNYWRQDGLEPAAALRVAQQWVRDTTNAEKAAYFKTALTEQPSANAPDSTADYLYKQMLLSRPDQRDFAHPFHWAAFSYTGV